jgi:tripartite-type tricarboxylate transporter receptor subunit TctC
VTSTSRSALLPNIPTVSESGVPGYDVTSWYGVFGPVGLPPVIVTKLHAEIGTVLKAPDLSERLAALGAQAAPTTPEDFGRIVREEIKRWADVVRVSGATIN